MLTFKTRYFAHRGLHGAQDIAPENSMEAFRRAIAKGIGIELDVQFSRDGQVVVFHDSGLDRVCGVCGRVSDYTYEELQTFSLHGSSQRIPLFSDVLTLVAGRVPLIIELKTPGNRYDRDLCLATAKLLDHYDGAYCIESFHPLILCWFRLHRPVVRRGQLLTAPSSAESGSRRLQLFLLETMITNLLTWPDFIACSCTLSRSPFFRFWRHISTPVAWTVRSAGQLKKIEKDFDYFIIEQVFSSD